jgi:hypothetical protein
MLRCTFVCDIFTARGWGYATRTINLPFAPTVGMKIEGLTEYPETSDDIPGDLAHETIKDIRWLHKAQKFIALLDAGDWRREDANPADAVLESLGRSWTYHDWTNEQSLKENPELINQLVDD